MSPIFTATVGMVEQPPRSTFHEALADLYKGINETKYLTKVFLEEACWIELSINGRSMVLKFYGCRDFANKVGLVRDDAPQTIRHKIGDPPLELIRQLFTNSMVTGGDPTRFIENLPAYSEAA